MQFASHTLKDTLPFLYILFPPPKSIRCCCPFQKLVEFATPRRAAPEFALLSAAKSLGISGADPASPFLGTASQQQEEEEGGGINLIGLAFGIWPPLARASKKPPPEAVCIPRERGGGWDGEGTSGEDAKIQGWGILSYQ